MYWNLDFQMGRTVKQFLGLCIKQNGKWNEIQFYIIVPVYSVIHRYIVTLLIITYTYSFTMLFFSLPTFVFWDTNTFSNFLLGDVLLCVYFLIVDIVCQSTLWNIYGDFTASKLLSKSCVFCVCNDARLFWALMNFLGHWTVAEQYEINLIAVFQIHNIYKK